jgi:hypothetical protein
MHKKERTSSHALSQALPQAEKNTRRENAPNWAHLCIHAVLFLEYVEVFG